MINVGIVGSGFIGPAHIEALRRLGVVQVVALCDGSLEQAQEKARALNVPHAYGSVDRLLAHRDCRWFTTARPTTCTRRLTGKFWQRANMCSLKSPCV